MKVLSWKLLLAVVMLVGLASTVRADDKADLEKWAKNHPDASSALRAWVKEYPNAAGLFFDWDAKHPARSKEFVKWTLEHPKADIKTFVEGHTGWPIFDDIAKDHKPAANAFMVWVREFPEPAKRLMDHDKGLSFAGEHLYKGLWVLKK